MTKTHSFRSLALLLLSLLASHSVYAQALRTWVSSAGNDSNPCSRSAPCQTFAAAISRTLPHGQINVVDAGSFGAVTITQSITIDASGNFAGVLSTGSSAITVNAASTDVVVLRGLTLDGAGAGGIGIRFLAGDTLHIENCVINNFAQKGIVVEPTTSTFLFIKDTVVRGNINAVNGGGILLKPSGAGSVRASITNVRSERNFFGLRTENNTETVVRDSVFTGNTGIGINALSTAGGNVQINMDESIVSNNVSHGVTANGLNAIVRLSNTKVTNNNGTGIFPTATGQVLTFGTNRIAGNNGGNGTFTGPAPAEQ